MRLSIRSSATHVGGVKIHETFRVTELDAGHCVEPSRHDALNGGFNSTTSRSNVAFSHESIHDVETQLAIVIPCMDEEQGLLDSVLHGVPHECLIVLVSNSNPVNFEAECRLLADFCNDTQRPGIVIHQRDEGLALAFHAAGMPEVVAETSQPQTKRGALRVRNGKGEAMMIGTAIAKLAGKHFIGFIDADNFVAGSVHEYCKVYAAGLHYALHCTENTGTTSSSDMAESTEMSYAMVRIKWNSKPKVKDGKLVFEKSGRCSRVVNEWMNRLLDALVGDITENRLIQTSNAGEHAMSLDLAMDLCFATGYAVEPFQLVNAWEQFGVRNIDNDQSLTTTVAQQFYTAHTAFCKFGTTEDTGNFTQDINKSATSLSAASHHSSVANPTRASTVQSPHNVRILQIETRNPHFHDVSKGHEHIQRMQVEGLSTIYHSRLVPRKLKDELRGFMKEEFPTAVGIDGEPERPRVYPPMRTLDFGVFRSVVKDKADTLKVVGDFAGKSML